MVNKSKFEIHIKFSGQDEILQQISKIVDYVNNANPGDHLADLARAVEDIDPAENLKIDIEFRDGAVHCTVSPAGQLSMLIDKFTEAGVL